MIPENKPDLAVFRKTESANFDVLRNARLSGKPTIEELARTLTPAQLSRLEYGPHDARIAIKNKSKTPKISP